MKNTETTLSNSESSIFAIDELIQVTFYTHQADKSGVHKYFLQIEHQSYILYNRNENKKLVETAVDWFGFRGNSYVF